MKSLLAFRRCLASAFVLMMCLGLAVPSAFATHLRGGTINWKVIATSGSTYTVQFTFTESSRWSYPNTPGICISSPSSCPALNSTVLLQSITGGVFAFGDATSTNPTGTVTAINQAQDVETVTFTFTHVYNVSATPYTAFFTTCCRLSTVKLGHDSPEYISTLVQNYPYPSPVASIPAILSVPLLPTTSFSLGSAVTDIDPNVNLVFRAATIPEAYGPGITSIACLPSGSTTSQTPPGFTISSSGIVTWDTTKIATYPGCSFGTPAAGNLWPTQIIVEVHSNSNGALITRIPVDLLMEFVTPVGALPTIVLNPSTTQSVEVGTPVTFTATGSSSNAGAMVTLNATGVPVGATATGLNATVTPPASSTFNWTPAAGQTGTFVITYTVTDSNLQQASASNTIVVASLPKVTCSAPITLAYGTSGTLTATLFDPSNLTLNVVWAVDGTAVQTHNGVNANPSTTDQLTQSFGNAGTHTVTVTATEPSGVSAGCSTSAIVNPADQTISFSPIPNVTYGVADFTVAATASSGLGVSYSAANNCTILAGTTVHVTAAGSCSVTASQAGNSNYNAAPNVVQSFNIGTAAVTATGGSGTAQYDGTMKTPSACVVAGAFTGDLACTNNPATVGPDAGTTAIVPNVTGTLSNYSITAANGSYAITQAPSVTAVSCPASVTYNGAAQAPCTAMVTGVGGLSQSVTVTYSGNLNAGTATASASFAGDTNHSASSGTATFTINQAPLSATAGSYSGIYDSSAHALSACVLSANPDGLTCSNNPSGPVGPDVGSGVVTPVIGGSTANYMVTSNAGAWSISALPVSVTAGSYSGVYDGNPHAVSSCNSTYAGVTCSNNPSSVGPGAGSGAVAPVPSAASGIPADYSITMANGSWSIAVATSFIALSCPPSVTYNGSAQTPCTATVSGAGGLSQSVPVTYTNNVGAGTATASAAFSGDANHSGSNNSATFTIAPALLTVTAGGYSGTYDGNPHALSACVVSANPDGLTCTNNPAGPVGPNVGSGVVTPAVGGSTANYSVTVNNGSWSITVAPTTVTLTCPTSVPYNQSAQTPCSAQVVGAGGPFPTLTIAYTNNQNAGTATASATYAGDANHSGSTNSTTFTITPVAITLTAGSYNGTYDANAHALSACTVTPGGMGLSCSNNPTGPVGPNVGSGTVSAALNGGINVSQNYVITSVSGSWSISPLNVTLAAGSYNAVYDGSAHAIPACLSSNAGVTCADSPASVGPGVGSGTVTPVASIVTGTAADYSLAPGSGSWSIAKAASAITITCPISVLYTGTVQTPCTAVVTGVGGLNQSVAVTYTNNIVGLATATASYAGDANHTGSTGANTFYILYSTGSCAGGPGHSILPPISPDGSTVRKQGSTVPAKFNVCDAFGNPVQMSNLVQSFYLVELVAGGSITHVQQTPVSTPPYPTFRWDGSEWIFNIDTKANAADDTYVYQVTLNDTSVIQFQFALK